MKEPTPRFANGDKSRARTSSYESPSISGHIVYRLLTCNFAATSLQLRCSCIPSQCPITQKFFSAFSRVDEQPEAGFGALNISRGAGVIGRPSARGVSQGRCRSAPLVRPPGACARCQGQNPRNDSSQVLLWLGHGSVVSSSSLPVLPFLALHRWGFWLQCGIFAHS